MRSAKAKQQVRPIVVLIEDDNRVAPALEMLIEDWGYDCIVARIPRTAADAVAERIPFVVAIVADLSRHDSFTGRRSANAIAEALGPDLPRIVTTNEAAMARSSGFAEVLEKPYDPEELKAWLRLKAGAMAPSCNSKSSANG